MFITGGLIVEGGPGEGGEGGWRYDLDYTGLFACMRTRVCECGCVGEGESVVRSCVCWCVRACVRALYLEVCLHQLFISYLGLSLFSLSSS